MAEINKFVSKKRAVLPFESMLRVDPQSIMQNIQKYKDQFGNNEIIKTDLNECEKNINRMVKDNFYSTKEREFETEYKKDSQYKDYSIEEMRALFKISQLVRDEDYDNAIIELDKSIKTSSAPKFKSRMLYLKSDILVDERDKKSAQEALFTLIDYNDRHSLSNNISNYLRLIRIEDDYEAEISFCDKILEKTKEII